jgi:endonuclease/exonuclease/phosphatase family metal-dependent hydrolase
MVHTANHLATSIIAYLITATSAMKLVTYNLRYDSKPNDITVQETLDSLPDPLTEPKYYATSKEQPWSTRRVRVVENLLNKGIVIAGFQEALVRQVHDLAELFGDEWSWIGVGRDDGFQAGEFSPLFYHKRSLTLLSNDSFWLSDTPFEPSKYPGAGSFRICTAARFTLHENGKDTNFSILNTHLDDQSDDQRKLAASLLLHRARYEAVTTGGPVLVQGDFNRYPTALTKNFLT